MPKTDDNFIIIVGIVSTWGYYISINNILYQIFSDGLNSFNCILHLKAYVFLHIVHK